MTTKLTDSGTQRAIDDAAERGAERALERSRTPVVQSSDSSSRMYEIAEEVNARNEPAHMRMCVKDGPVCDVYKRIEKMENNIEGIVGVQRRHDDFINQYLGEQKFKRFVMPVLIGFVGSAAGVGLMSLVFRGLLLASGKVVP